ncbi:molybdate ABC transporter substrate-binding protein [Photobacterium sp. CCB-ST2H9]|uniref:molybdate ABC transporter substrate-binding protein n=1 Tax=Photobacterium sp. CCB-ST2H9 TaxID=2912855 RepID=UPI0020036098|nr:molybdate ABC transporter substrate-binding protein [Photobacterium sp. CCB-ST2H9]UTM60215.1 molybdate ABC transporter substrate-binding protein [Photobacterium sp. CCB-ST2H9]
MMRLRWWKCLPFVFLLSLQPVSAKEKVLVFAASSLTNALTELADRFEKKTGDDVILSFASSSALARQLAQGAPADLYISANTKWMDYVIAQKAANADSRKDLLHNQLVLITHISSPENSIELNAQWDIAASLQGSRLAVGDPAHVPAGLYAKQALEGLGLWQQAEPRLARANNVRAALLLVERQEAELGIVYQSDASIAENVKVLARFPAETHQPITYPMVLTKKVPSAAAKAFYAYMESAEAATIFRKFGFSTNG